MYNDRFVDENDAWRHSKWCEFMYQRLLLARDLLTLDGVIVVSIDDHEMPSLALIMKQVFGEHAFIATCVWQKRYSRENREAIGDAHEYLLVFAPDPDLFKERRGMIPMTEKQLKVYKNTDKNPRGAWRSVSLAAQGFRPNQMYEIVGPTGKKHRPPEGACWKVIESEYMRLLAEGRIYFGKDGSAVPSRIRYLDEVEGVVPWTWWPHEEVGHTDEARKEIQDILGTQTAFTTPKPVRLLERVLQICCGPDDLVLDFFAGSGTTAHAVLKVNAADGGRRRFLLVSNTEATVDVPDKNLCRDVCAQRLRNVIQGYNETPGLSGDFAYLRCRRVPVGNLIELDHAQVWLALQLMHQDAVAPWPDVPFATAGDETGRLVYVARVRRGDFPALRAAVKGCASAVVYSWQPEALRPHLRGPQLELRAIPRTLAERFGVKL